MSDLTANMFVSVEGRSEKWWLLEVDHDRDLGRITPENDEVGISFDLPLKRIAAWTEASDKNAPKRARKMTDHVRKKRKSSARGR